MGGMWYVEGDKWYVVGDKRIRSRELGIES